MKRVIAIGDIHGCIKTFEKLLTIKLQIQKTDEIYCIGDYIDRGNGSKEVIDLILKFRSEGYHIYTLRGNHEQMMLDSIIDESHLNLWLRNGGVETLRSFGIESFTELHAKYMSFFYETQLYIETEKFIFVHAGLNFKRDNIFEDKEAMLWIRDFPSKQPALKKKLLIHGHTPKPLQFIIHQKGNCINIDGGCVYKHLDAYGKLVAIDLEKQTFSWEKNCE